jgi:hypothetical protein
MAVSYVNVVINLLNIRCVRVELHAIKKWLSTHNLHGLCATTLKIVTVA